MWNLKYDKMTIYKTEIDSQTQKTHWGYQRGKGRINWKCVVNGYTLPYTKYIKNKDLLYSTGNYAQYIVITYMEKNLKKNIYI